MVPVIESVSATPSVNEGGAVSVSGSFSDVGSLDTHTLEIAWGDGTTSPATIDPVARTFTASHTYLDDDPTGTASDAYAIDLTLSDDDGGVATAQVQTVVSNVAPVIESVSATAAVDENGTVTVSGSFSDASGLDNHTLTIAWGDGTLSAATIDPVARTFTASHTYLDDDPSGTASDAYVIDLTLSDDDGGVATAQVQTVVSNVAPVIESVSATAGVDENGTVTVSGSFADASGLDSHTLTIAWGDGTTSAATIDPVARTFTASHTYLDDDPSGTASDAYAIDLTLSDDDGGVATAQVQTVVSNVVPVIESVSATAAVDENGTVTVSGSFSDASGLDSHTLTIAWGDGTLSAATIDPVARTFTASHTYLDDDPSGTASDAYTIGLTLTDDDGGVGTAQGADGGVEPDAGDPRASRRRQPWTRMGRSRSREASRTPAGWTATRSRSRGATRRRRRRRSTRWRGRSRRATPTWTTIPAGRPRTPTRSTSP